MEPLATLIRDSQTETIQGLRAKTLIAVWDCRPVRASHDGCLNFEDPVSHWSLFDAAVAVTGLSDMVSALLDRLQAQATIEEEEAVENEADPEAA